MIKIEVTGNSIAEVSDKLLVIGAALQSPPQTVALGVGAGNYLSDLIVATRAANGAEAAKPTVGTEAAKRTRKQKVSVEEGNAAPDADGTGGTTQTEAAAEVPAETQTEATPASPERAYDFDKEVAPLVLRVVQSKGPDAIRAILDQFGVQRASQVDPARYGELVGLLEEALV